MLTQQNEHLHTKIKGRDKEYGILAKSLITHTNKISIAHERHEDLLTKLDTMANEWSNEDLYNKKNNNQKKNNKNNKTEGRKEKDVSAIDMLCNSLKEAIGNVQLEAEKVASLLETKNNSSGTSTGATGTTGSTSNEKVSKNEETKIDSKKMSPKQGKRRNKKKKNKKK